MEGGIDCVCGCICGASAIGVVGSGAGPGVGVGIDGEGWVIGVADDTSPRTSGGLGVATSSPPPGSPGRSALEPSIMTLDPLCVEPSPDPSSIDPSFMPSRDPDIPPLTDPGVRDRAKDGSSTSLTSLRFFILFFLLRPLSFSEPVASFSVCSSDVISKPSPLTFSLSLPFSFLELDKLEA